LRLPLHQTEGLIGSIIQLVGGGVARIHEMITEEIQPKRHVDLQMILRRNLVSSKYKGIYRIQALEANRSHPKALIF
jgi:hypothetical protein